MPIDLKARGQMPNIIPPEPFPSAQTPVIYSDGLANFANTNHIVKMVFTRADLDAVTSSAYKVTITASMVMPLDGFINMFLFLQDAMAQLKEGGYVTDEMVRTIAAARKPA